MKNRCVKHLKFLLFFIVLQSFSQACSLLERPSATKRNEKVERKLQREAEKEYKQVQKQHIELQSDAARKMMKSMDRKNKKWLKRKKR